MEVVRVYKCLCDWQRLRILNLLRPGPLCVSHLQAILGQDQVRVSKQLGYMRKHEIVKSTRHANWMVYSLPDPPNDLLLSNLNCVVDAQQRADLHELKSDLEKREALIKRIKENGETCPPVVLESVKTRSFGS